MVSNFKYCNLHASRQKQEACFGMLVSQLPLFIYFMFFCLYRSKVNFTFLLDLLRVKFLYIDLFI